MCSAWDALIKKMARFSPGARLAVLYQRRAEQVIFSPGRKQDKHPPSSGSVRPTLVRIRVSAALSAALLLFIPNGSERPTLVRIRVMKLRHQLLLLFMT